MFEINKIEQSWFNDNYELRESRTVLDNPDPNEVGASLGLAGITIQYQLFDKNRGELLEDTWPVGTGFHEIIREVVDKYMDVEKDLKWDLSKIYKDDESIEKDISLVNDWISKIEKLKNNDQDNLLSQLELSENISRVVSKLYAYSTMVRDEDSTISSSQRRLMEVENLYAKASSATSHIEPAILKLSDSEVDEVLKDEKYSRYHLQISKILRYKNYTLSEKEEAILSEITPAIDSSQSAYYMLQNADIKYGEVKDTNKELTNANYINFMLNNKREVRKSAFELMYSTQKSYENTVGNLLYSNIRDKSKVAKIRGYKNLLEMELYKDNLSEEIYDTLIKVVNEYLPYYQKYFKLRNKMLGLKEAHMYDVYTNITTSNEVYSYKEAQNIILEALKPLGKEYTKLINRAFEESWIDVYPRDKKASGAYSYGTYDTDPYILLNYTDDLNSVFTLAHELGHSIHSYYSRKYNNYLESNYTIFVAEVASTFNENLVLEYMLNHAKTKEEKLNILNHHIESFKSTVFRQTMFAEFEKTIHEKVDNGAGLSGQDFSEIYIDLNQKYFKDSVVSDEYIKYEWMRIPHFYRNFYVYKYATGFIASTILADKVLNGDEDDLNKYFNFLKDGSNNYPLDQLKAAGADLTDINVLRTAMDIFKEKIKELELLVE